MFLTLSHSDLSYQPWQSIITTHELVLARAVKASMFSSPPPPPSSHLPTLKGQTAAFYRPMLKSKFYDRNCLFRLDMIHFSLGLTQVGQHMLKMFTKEVTLLPFLMRSKKKYWWYYNKLKKWKRKNKKELGKIWC